MSISLDELLQKIAKAKDLPKPRVDDSSVTQPEVPELFVAPEFEPSADQLGAGSAGVPRVILVSAAAAVGKTWLARALSAYSGNPLWDLSRLRLGSNFFIGTLTKRYGGSGYADFEERLREGRATLMLDAADEAIVSSGLGNYEAALRDLAELVTDEQQDSAAVVLFGRPDTIEITAVLLSEIGLWWESYDVDYFSADRSLEFVLAKMGVRTEAARSEATEFTRDFFGTVRVALGEEVAHQQDFLGYAPVLDALAAFYKDQPNPHAVFQKIKSSRSSEHVWSLLLQVIEEICNRECGKLIASFGQGNPTRESLAARAYRVEEQLRLLLSPSLATAMIDLPNDLDDATERHLVTAWRSLFEEHPFLRRGGLAALGDISTRFSNAIFRDFLLYKALLIADEGSALDLTGTMSSDHFNPSPIFAKFMIAGVANRDYLLQALIIPPLLESVQADRASRPVHVRIGEDHEKVGDSTETTAVVSMSPEGERAVTFRTALPSPAGLSLGRSVARVSFDMPSVAIYVTPAHQDFLIEDDVEIVCAAFVCNVQSVRVQGRGDSIVRIVAEEFRSSTQRVEIGHRARVQLLTRSRLQFPWHRYSAADNEDGLDPYLAYASALQLRRITQWFSRRSMTGRMTYPTPAMDTILKKGRASGYMFQFLQHTGNMEQEGDVYQMHEPASVTEIMGIDLNSPELRNYVTNYLNWLESEGVVWV